MASQQESTSEQSQDETREVSDHLRRQNTAIMVIEANQVPAEKGRSKVEGNKENEMTPGPNCDKS